MEILAPLRVLGSGVSASAKLPHPVLPVRQERAELFTHKHPGTKPPLQGKGGKKIKPERT